MTQEELIDKAVKETFNLLHMPCALDVLAKEAIKTYIKLKDMENTNINLMDRILDLSCSDLTDLLRGLNMILKDSHISQRELFNRFGSCLFVTKDKSVNMLVDKNDKFIYVINDGDEVTIYGYKSKADILKAVGLTNEVVNTRKDEIVELIEKIKNTPKGTCDINNINNTKRDHLGCIYEKKICNHNGECRTCPTAKRYNHPHKEVNESDIEKVVQEEYTESKHDCGDIPQITSEDREELIDYAIQRLGGNQYPKGSLLAKLEREQIGKMVNEAISQYKQDLSKTDAGVNESSGKGADEDLNKESDEGLLSSHATTPITTTTPTTPTSNTAYSSHLHHSSKGHLLKVTKKYPHRINQLQLLHNKHKIQQLSKIELTQGVSILECDIIWNDDVWSDEHIVPYNVAVYEGELAKDVDSEVGFQFYSFDEMYDYLEWKPNQDFTIVRIRDYYTTINK